MKKAELTGTDYPLEPVPLENLSVDFMKQSCFVPIRLEGGRLTVAAGASQETDIEEALRFAYDLEVSVLTGREDDILETIERLYGAGSQSLETIIEEADKNVHEITTISEDDVDHLRDMASEAPIIRLVNRLILNAVEMRASDIHFEPFENEFKVRYRIDGVLTEVEFPPKRLQAAVISRVKIMSRLDIAERRRPQDGRIKLRIGERDIDFRVSTIPTLYGESLVMRILDSETLVLDLKKLGFPSDMLSQYEELIKQPYGMILVTGPTGSGKTSTLYTTLSMINSPETKIITIEDPVEYQLKGVNQVHVNPKIGLTFANALRSIVRQDPDVILVGEIRDRETAEIAVQSALTGHLLFSTLHTNDSAGALTRLLDMGVESFLLSSTLLGVLAQRLVRVICPQCKVLDFPDKKKLEAFGSAEAVKGLGNISFYRGKGCDNCRQSGFFGRTGIFEYLPMDEDIRKEIVKESDTDRIKYSARKKGVKTLREDGLRKACEGITTISEVLRVTVET